MQYKCEIKDYVYSKNRLGSNYIGIILTIIISF